MRLPSWPISKDITKWPYYIEVEDPVDSIEDCKHEWKNVGGAWRGVSNFFKTRGGGSNLQFIVFSYTKNRCFHFIIWQTKFHNSTLYNKWLISNIYNSDGKIIKVILWKKENLTSIQVRFELVQGHLRNSNTLTKVHQYVDRFLVVWIS